MSIPLRVDAPAKLNLSLHVVGRREDGHHLLDGLFVQLELADRLLLLPGCSGLRVEGESAGDLPLGATNLAWRGLVAGLDGEPELACLTVEKRIPAEAGLGGGSSDAAAAWRLGRAWRGLPDVPTEDDLAVLASIGADVPFLAGGRVAARIGGIGEKLTPATVAPSHVVLVHPPFGMSTAAVFAELRRDEWGTAENDLVAPATRLRPDLAGYMARVARVAGDARLSGSGSTIFVIEPDAERAERLATELSDDGLHARVTRIRTEPTRIEAIEDEEDP